MFSIDIYDSMMDNEETWIVTCPGNAMLVNDCALMDC